MYAVRFAPNGRNACSLRRSPSRLLLLLRSTMETEAAAEAMAYDGALSETLVILVERDSCDLGYRIKQIGSKPADL